MFILIERDGYREVRGFWKRIFNSLSTPSPIWNYYNILSVSVSVWVSVSVNEPLTETIFNYLQAFYGTMITTHEAHNDLWNTFRFGWGTSNMKTASSTKFNRSQCLLNTSKIARNISKDKWNTSALPICRPFFTYFYGNSVVSSFKYDTTVIFKRQHNSVNFPTGTPTN